MMTDLGLLLIRVVVGVVLTGHGLQKLAGWFGGRGLAGTAHSVERLGLRPARVWAIVAGLSESCGGLLFALGLLNPMGSILIGAVMLMAIVRVHWPKGLWNMSGGFEYPLVNLTVVIGVALAGPGAYALDTAFGVKLPVATLLVSGLLAALAVAIPTPEIRPAGEQKELKHAA